MRSLTVALFVASAATAQPPDVVATAARQRQDALPSVGFDLRLKSEKEVGTLRLSFDGAKARYERRTTKTGMNTHWTAATNGERVKISLLWESGNTNGRDGTINPLREGVCRSFDLLPLTLAARPLDPSHCSLELDKFTPAGTADVDGWTCEEYRGTPNGESVTVWLDPAAGHVLRRLRLTDALGKTVREINVELSKDNTARVWMPTAYTDMKTTSAGRNETHEFTVERVEVGKQYPDTEFDPPWPAGVRVHDLINGGEFVSDATGELHPADCRSVWNWVACLWWVPVTLVGLTAGLIGWRMWRRRRVSG